MWPETLSRDDLKARWAWSELTSPRFRQEYEILWGQANSLLVRAKHQQQFDSLDQNDVSALVKMLSGRQALASNLDWFENFVLRHWTRNELANALVLGNFRNDQSINSSFPYSKFIIEPDRDPVLSDPRHTTDSWISTWPPNTLQPGIAIPVNDNGQHLLLDGYGRSVLFWRKGAIGDTYPVYLPE